MDTTDEMLKAPFAGTRVVVLRGIAGAGKTTYADALCRAADAHRIPSYAFTADVQTYTQPDGVVRARKYDLHNAHAKCLREFTVFLVDRAQQAHEGSALMIVDNSSIHNEEVAPYASLAKAFGAELHLVALRCDPYAALARATATHPEEETLVRSVKLLKEIQFAPVWWPRHLVLTTDRV